LSGPEQPTQKRWRGGKIAILNFATQAPLFSISPAKLLKSPQRKRILERPLLMIGLLLQSGQDILSTLTVRRQKFNEKMVRFYESAEPTEMMAFLSRCQIRSKFD
jgi:hypothetical protein